MDLYIFILRSFKDSVRHTFGFDATAITHQTIVLETQ